MGYIPLINLVVDDELEYVNNLGIKQLHMNTSKFPLRLEKPPLLPCSLARVGMVIGENIWPFWRGWKEGAAKLPQTCRLGASHVRRPHYFKHHQIVDVREMRYLPQFFFDSQNSKLSVLKIWLYISPKIKYFHCFILTITELRGWSGMLLFNNLLPWV